jgi:hypothetical protein
MIRAKHLVLLGAALLASACDRPASRNRANAVDASNGSGNLASRQAQAIEDGRSAQTAGARSVPVSPDVREVVLEKQDILVDGEPSCALTVRYGEGPGQPVTWRGEKCGQILVRLSSIEDLRKIGQDSKLNQETLEDLGRLPNRRALYIEGNFTSAIYPENVMGRLYEVPLAD